MNFAVSADHRVKLKEREKRISTSTSQGNRKTVEHESDDYTNCNWGSWYSHQRIGKRTGGPGNNGMNGDHPNYSIIEIGQNTEKSPVDLKKLAVIQTLSERSSANVLM